MAYALPDDVDRGAVTIDGGRARSAAASLRVEPAGGSDVCTVDVSARAARGRREVLHRRRRGRRSDHPLPRAH